MPPKSTFVTRQVEIPDSPEGSPPSSFVDHFAQHGPGHGGAQAHSQAGVGAGAGAGGRHGGTTSHGSSPASGSAGSNSLPPPPAIPSALFDALAREPPTAKSPSYHSTSSSVASSAATGRSSLSFSRPGVVAPASPPPADSNSMRSPALPAITPHSPLHLFSSTPNSPSNVPARAHSASPARDRRMPKHKPSLGPDDLPRPMTSPSSSTNLGPQRSRATSQAALDDPSLLLDQGAPLGGGFVSVGQGDYASQSSLPSEPERSGSTSKRSMWKSVAFGRSSSKQHAPDSPQLSDGPLQSSWGSSSRSSALPTSPPLNGGAIYSRNPPTSSTGLSPSPQLPPSPAPNRSKPNSPSVSRSPSTARLRSPTGPKGASKWLYDSQAPDLALLRKGATSPPPLPSAEVGLALGDPSHQNGKATVDESEDDDDEEDDEDDEPSPWSAGRGQQYTHDLTKGLRRGAVASAAYESEGDAGGGSGGVLDGGAETEGDEDGFDDAEEELVVAGSIGLPDSEAHFSRRRPDNPLRIATDGGPPVAGGGGLRTAPILAGSSLQETQDSLRNRSWSDGDVSLAGKAQESELAKGMGLSTPSIGSSSSALPQQPHHGRARKAEFTMAIVGPRNVGKSTVIRRGVKNPSRPSIIKEDEHGNRVTTSTSSFMISGQPRTLEILEIDSALLQYNSEGLIWPVELPLCEGVMICFDATDPDAVPALLQLLQGFWTRGSSIPTIVLACKASSSGENATDLAETAAKCNAFGPGIVSLDGGVEDKGQKMRQCVNYMIRHIMDTRGETRNASSPIGSSGDFAAGSHPEMTSLPPAGAPLSSAPPPLHSPSVLDPGPTFENPFAGGTPPRTSNGNGSLGLEVVRESPVGVAPVVEEQVTHPFPSKPTGPTAAETIESLEQMNRSKSSALDLHFGRDDVIDKFLFASVTGNDDPYMTLFLIVYRRFVRPYDVVSKLIQRFEFVANRIKSDPLLSRFAQMKLCGTLSTWFSYYPGDFSAPSTAGLLRPFLEDLLPRGATWVAHHAVELLPQLSQVSQLQDPEGSWALPDKPLFDAPVAAPDPTNFRRPSLAPSYDSAASSSHLNDSSIEGSNSRLSVPGSLTQQHDSATTAPSTADSRARSGSDAATSDSNERSSAGPSSNTMSRRGKSLVDSTLLDLSNALLELPEEVVAQQITRIAWGAFSHMTPRDLMRHVLAPRDPKNPRALLRDDNSNVMQSINFVNYLADWVATMILIQSKLKWRARILEKFIHIAYQLRVLENFDSLMGVLAGLNSQPVFRLAETMETVNLKLEGDRTKIPKRLRSLNKLMATTKSFAAYRLALANSGTEMLPYLGVHLQDITVVNEVKSDMRDGKVNWSKFSQMGRSAAIVLDCSRQPPVYSVDRGVERCILNVPLLDKDRQYDLSYAYSPRAAQEGSTSTRQRLRNVKAALF